METYTFDCTVLTPMHLCGAHNDATAAPELRAPSFKWMMRFWWRAAWQGNDAGSMRTEEARLFGGSADLEAKAPFILRCSSKANSSPTDIYPLLPGKPRGQDVRRRCFKPGESTFQVAITGRRRGNGGDCAAGIFELAAILGGVGRRSRRGLGCFLAVPDDVAANTNEEDTLNAHIVSLLNEVLPSAGCSYSADATMAANGESYIRPSNPSLDFHYPNILYIGTKQTQTALTWDTVLRRIREVSHTYSADDCGSGGRGNRLASPVYVSLYKWNDELYVVVTLLNSDAQRDRDYQQRFIDEVFNHV